MMLTTCYTDTMASRRFDVIIFGATGITGKHCIEEIIKTQNGGKAGNFTWAIAGRNIKKLRTTLKEMAEISGTGFDHSTIDCIIADVSKYESLSEMASQCQVLINTAGPFAQLGEPVIKACIQEKTHYVDITGETVFVTEMQLKYHKEAEEAGVYIVPSCGFDSIPAECGINFLKQNFDGELNSVESYMNFDNLWGNKINYGTWQSLIHLYAEIRRLRPLLNELYPPEKIRKPKYRLKNRFIHFNNDGDISGYCLPFSFAPDDWAVEKSQNYMHLNYGSRPIQYVCYFKQSNIFLTLLTVIATIFIGILTQFNFGIWLLETFPGIFSFGLINRGGPTREQMHKFKFSFTMVGNGWAKGETSADIPNKKLVVKVEGVNPAYGATCTALLQSALTVMEEHDKMPSTGGVFTAGAAFNGTKIIERLNNHGLTFKVVS